MPENALVVESFLQAPGDEEATRALVEAARGDPGSVLPRLHRAAGPVTAVPSSAGFHMNNLEIPHTPRLAAPADRAETAALLLEASRQGRRVKGLGGAWSFSTAAWTRGTLVHHPRQRGVRPEPVERLRASEQARGLYRVQAGATIADIYAAMGEVQREPCQRPGFNELTWVGASSTGAHGSGIRVGPLADYTRAVELLTVTAAGELRRCRVESARRPVTDPAEWARRQPDVELVADDDHFNAARVGFGTLGLVTAMVIESQPRTWLREDRTLHRWHEVKALIPALHADPATHSFHVWVNPYEARHAGKRGTWCVLSQYTHAPANSPPRGARGVSMVLGGLGVVGEVVAAIANAAPRHVPQLVQAAMEGTLSRGVVLPSFKALDFGPPNHLPVVACGFGVAAHRAVEVVEALVELLRARPAGVGWVTSTLGVRFTRAGEAHLGMQQGRDTCMVEVPVLRHTDGARGTLDAILRSMMDRFDARPHWGQFNSMTGADARRLYPEFAAFARSYREFNPRGTFDNVLTRAMRFGAG